MAKFKINDKVRLVRMSDEYNRKTGIITGDAGKEKIPVGTRKLGECFKTKDGQQQWIVMLDDTNGTMVVSEANLEKVS